MTRNITLIAIISFLVLLSPSPLRAYCLHRDTGAVVFSPGMVVEDCCDGRPARWLAQDQPVPVYIWDQTAQEFHDDIAAAIDTWNSIPSSTFRMQLMGTTTLSEAPTGNIIIGFDPNRCSEDPECDPDNPPLASAGCSTKGDGTDNYHIDRCTIMGNGENIDWGTGPAKDDPQWVITHELGHVLGIMHPGATPRDPGSHGCGEDFRGATMACCGGQQDASTLELDDVAAATALYPAWSYTVKVVDAAGMPISGVTVNIQGTCFPHDGVNYTEGGMVLGDINECLIGEGEASNTHIPQLTYATGSNGLTGVFRVLHNEFCLSAVKPGFKTAEGCQLLTAPGNYITTVTLNLDVEPVDCNSSALPRTPAGTALALLGLASLALRRRKHREKKQKTEC